MKLSLLLCLIAAGTPILVSSQGFYCMSGVPCGNGCTMSNGLCINGQCFDSTGTIQWECMAPMPAMGGRKLLQNWGFNSWMPPMPPMPSFRPWLPFGAFGPFGPFGRFADCGGRGPCDEGQFCDVNQVCRPDDCTNQFKYGCPGDNGQLQKVVCPHFGGFKECYASSTGGFRCFKGPSGSSVACATDSGLNGGASFTMTAGYHSSGPYQTIRATSADGGDTTKQSAYKKVVTEAGPAAAPAATAASTAKSVKDGKPAAKPVYLTQAGAFDPVQEPTRRGRNALQVGPMMPPPGMFAPGPGMVAMTAGPGPDIAAMNVGPNGRAGGMASGEYKTVTTKSGPGGTASMTTSVSKNGGPATAVATAESVSGPETMPAEQPRQSEGEQQLPKANPVSSRDGAKPTGAATAADQASAKPVPPNNQVAQPAKNSAGNAGGWWLRQAVFAGCIHCVALLLLL